MTVRELIAVLQQQPPGWFTVAELPHPRGRVDGSLSALVAAGVVVRRPVGRHDPRRSGRAAFGGAPWWEYSYTGREYPHGR